MSLNDVGDIALSVFELMHLNPEKRLSRLVDIGAAASELSIEERRRYLRLSKEFVKAIKSSGKELFNFKNLLGPACALSFERNYLMTLMVANAVKHFRRTMGRSPLVGELGSGTGLNAVAVCYADSGARYVGYEKCDVNVEFARARLKYYGLGDRAEIREKNFLLDDLDISNIDIVINENLNPDFINEPQFRAANLVLPYTHKDTLFVPGGLDFYFRGHFGEDFREERVDVNKVRFSKGIPSPLVLTYTFDPWDLPIDDFNIQYSCDIVDFNGNTVLRKRSKHQREIQYFSLTPKPELVKVDGTDPSLAYELMVTLKYESSINWFPKIRLEIVGK